MHDIQALADTRDLKIDQVGVRDLRYPISVLDRSAGKQETVATISLSVSLSKEVRGTHMSRFLEVLNDHRGELTARTIPALLSDLQAKLQAQHAFIDISFPYFLERPAPVTGATGLLDYNCRFVATAGPHGGDFMLAVEVPVTSLCPCSKAISDYGAHNQRGYISVAVRTLHAREIMWIEDLAELVEDCASSPVYPLLKRPDERHVTMQAFDRPAFVEDIARDVATALRRDGRIVWYRVEAVNMESIHNHSAYAVIEQTLDVTLRAVPAVEVLSAS